MENEISLADVDEVVNFHIVPGSKVAYDFDNFVKITKKLEWPLKAYYEAFPGWFDGDGAFPRSNKGKLLIKLGELPDITGIDIIALGNMEQRAETIRLLGGGMIKDELGAILVDTQILVKTQPRWDLKGRKPDVTFEDTYILWKIPKEIIEQKIGGKEAIWRNSFKDIYMVECKCTTTDRTFFIFTNPNMKDATKDAIAAIATTIGTTVPLEQIDYVLRQGDTVHTLCKPGTVCPGKVPLWFFTKDNYLKLLKSES